MLAYSFYGGGIYGNVVTCISTIDNNTRVSVCTTDRAASIFGEDPSFTGLFCVIAQPPVVPDVTTVFPRSTAAYVNTGSPVVHLSVGRLTAQVTDTLIRHSIGSTNLVMSKI